MENVSINLRVCVCLVYLVVVVVVVGGGIAAVAIACRTNLRIHIYYLNGNFFSGSLPRSEKEKMLNKIASLHFTLQKLILY